MYKFIVVFLLAAIAAKMGVPVLSFFFIIGGIAVILFFAREKAVYGRFYTTRRQALIDAGRIPGEKTKVERKEPTFKRTDWRDYAV